MAETKQVMAAKAERRMMAAKQKDEPSVGYKSRNKATANRAIHSALIKIEKKIPYADAFGVDLAAILRDTFW